MLFYAMLLLASFIASYIILWILRIISANSNSYSTHHVSPVAERNIVRNGVKRYAKNKKRAATRKPGSAVKPATKPSWGFNPNAGYNARSSKLSGQAYKPSAQAVSAFALKASED